jgi:hypothetical protein
LLLTFDATAAKAVGIVGGVVVLVLTACTAWPTGLIKSIPPPAHAIFDLLIAVVLIASPFLFGFSDESTPTAVFIVAGVLDLLFAIATRFTPEPRTPRRPRGDSTRTPASSSSSSAPRS